MYKLPKKITILGNEYKVKEVNKADFAGFFDCNSHTIVMNKQCIHNYPSTLLHEIVEIIAQEMRSRWNFRKPIRIGDRNLLGNTIILAHEPNGIDEFTVFCKVLYQVLKDNNITYG